MKKKWYEFATWHVNYREPEYLLDHILLVAFVHDNKPSYNDYVKEAKSLGVSYMPFDKFVSFGFGITRTDTPYTPPEEDLILQS